MKTKSSPLTRRAFLGSISIATAGMCAPGRCLAGRTASLTMPLALFDYSAVELASEPHEKQLEQTRQLLMDLSDDSLLKPLRQMSGMPAPGEDLGGWYHYSPDYHWGDREGFAPSCTYGQWISALARMYAIRPAPDIKEKVLRLNRLYAQTISDDYYDKNRFPTYCYDKIVRGLVDSHKYLEDPDALAILEHTTDTALPHFPKGAVEHGTAWRPNKDHIWTWDESYTISENLFVAYESGAGARYRDLGRQYLLDSYYDPLAEGRNVLAGRHAYSHVNSLGSAAQAYLTLGSQKHLRAAVNGFEMLSAQSYATGGWGPDETLRAPGSDDLFNSLANTHNSFETPCGAYAHFKLTRHLLRITREAKYADSMERMMYDTVLGARPLMRDGRTFYYSDYNNHGHKFYKEDQHWSCCSGTLPQVAADYRINCYFHEPRGIWVNLYLPSTLRWNQDGARMALTQKSDYPFDPHIEFTLEASHARNFTLNLRVPAWTGNAELRVNGRRWPMPLQPGSFAAVHRRWRTGDRLELVLPMNLRLEPLDAQHPDTVALAYGPLVLFPLVNAPPPVSRADLLAATRVGRTSWQVASAQASFRLLPFTDIADEQYSTYLQVHS